MGQKQIPDLSGEKSLCCGCGACYSICPVDAIEMITDEKGFKYPIIREEKCIRCYKCIKVCAFKRDM